MTMSIPEMRHIVKVSSSGSPGQGFTGSRGQPAMAWHFTISSKEKPRLLNPEKLLRTHHVALLNPAM